MSDYTTITLPKSLKEELSEEKADTETWVEYLHRLRDERTDTPTDDHQQLSDEDLVRVRDAVQDVAGDLQTGDNTPDHAHAASLDIDYDQFREIVREEVRRALEDVVR